MSFSATFYTFQKRINSTKQPTGGSSYNIILKEGCSVNHPTIALDMGLASSPAALNYCYITEFGRYYWVKWRFEDRLWIGECNVDPLASFKTQIGASNCYIARAASSYDLRVVDTYYPATAKNTHEADIITSPFLDNTNGTWIIGTQGESGSANGGSVSYYACADGAIQGLINYFLGDPSFYGQSDISDDLLKCVFNPMQFMVSCMWFPFDVSVINGDVGFGWWHFNNQYIKPVSSSLVKGSNLTFNIPKHPKATTRGEYLNLPPFAEYRLEAGPWGIIPLDPFNLLDATSLDCYYKVDLITGSGIFNVKFRDKLIYESSHTAQIGVPVQMGQNVINQGAISSFLSGVSSTTKQLLTGDVAGALASGFTAIGDAGSLSQAVPSSVGSNGTKAFNNSFGLMADFKDIANEDLQGRGRPLCQTKTISSLSGYIMCADADPEVSCSDEELSMIVQYMNNGFFYE